MLSPGSPRLHFALIGAVTKLRRRFSRNSATMQKPFRPLLFVIFIGVFAVLVGRGFFCALSPCHRTPKN